MKNKENLKFPIFANYRIIALDKTYIKSLIASNLKNLGIMSKLQKGNTSRNNKYVSFNIDIFIQSKKMMHLFDNEIRSIEGVQMIL